jgi:hypothetical protein
VRVKSRERVTGRYARGSGSPINYNNNASDIVPGHVGSGLPRQIAFSF